MSARRLLALALAILFVAGGCAPYASVSPVRPRYRPSGATSAPNDLELGLGQEKRDPLTALGAFLDVADTARQQLARDPANISARQAYNFAVARVIGTIAAAKLDPWTHPLRVPAKSGNFILTLQPNPQRDPALYDLTPADQLTLKGRYVAEHLRREGLGAPVVAANRRTDESITYPFAPPKLCLNFTALIRFEHRRAVIDFQDPQATERVSLEGRNFPLAADFTAPIAMTLAQFDPRKLELPRLLHPEKYAGTAGIIRLDPYDPNKTVVLAIHGLMDSPATWATMLNHLRADPRISRRYQFWLYSYPSGYPYPYSAALLRRELDETERRFPLKNKMIVIGHSMGGCIARLLVTDPGEKLWLRFFGKPPAQVPLSPESTRLYRDALIFRSRPEIGRVIFISTPLRGSRLASTWMGRVGSSLVRSPQTLLQASSEVYRYVLTEPSGPKLKRIPNSIDTLTPDNPFVAGLDPLPLARGVQYHVICGDRGRGGNKSRLPPVMSDGVVPYWSSHLDQAQSELIVPSAHSAHHHPLAIAEVQRILDSTP